MGDKTGIQWCDATWNPIRGCSRVSEGCRHCYAEAVAARFCGPGQPYEGLVKVITTEKVHRRDFANGSVELRKVETRDARWNGEVRFVAEHLADPLRWRKPRRIFVNSMSDLFHESLTNEQIAAVFGVMAAAPQHTFQVLTKRARRMREWFEWRHRDPQWAALRCQEIAIQHGAWISLLDPTGYAKLGWPLPNVWLGVSVENQAAADERIPELLATPAAVRFISAEPLLGELDLDVPRCGYRFHEEDWGIADDGATPWCMRCDSERSFGHWLNLDGGIDWVIAGCESGPGARPCEVEWLRSLRDQCAEAGVAYFLKQAREHHEQPEGFLAGVRHMPGSTRKPGGIIGLPYLDGVQHAAFPEVKP